MKNKKLTNRKGHQYEYTGEVDQDGKLCGSGFYVPVGAPHIKYEGTFYNDVEHGISE